MQINDVKVNLQCKGQWIRKVTPPTTQHMILHSQGLPLLYEGMMLDDP